MEKIDIHLKGGFSERKGLKHFSNIIQKDDLNMRTRNKIYSVFDEIMSKLCEVYIRSRYASELFIETIYVEIFSFAIDEVPIYRNALAQFKSIICSYEYSEVFTFIEGFIKTFNKYSVMDYTVGRIKREFIDAITKIFSDENVDYHIQDDKITDITNEEQIKSIDETLDNKYDVVSKHYKKALELLYESKDYSNSIKESISSVEAMCQIIDGSKKSLGNIIKKLNIGIHPTLANAYSTLYGYTSDENGSRHANGIGEKNATYEEARYMLVSCSAFVNYLMNLYEKSNK